MHVREDMEKVHVYVELESVVWVTAYEFVWGTPKRLYEQLQTVAYYEECLEMRICPTVLTNVDKP